MALQDTSGPASSPPSGEGAAGPDVIVVGAASRDLTQADPRGWRLGGAVCYSALQLGRLGLRVGALVGVDAVAAAAPELDLLRAALVDVRLVPLARGPVFANRELPAGREQLALEVSDGLPTSALPPTWSSAPGLLLAPVAGELGPEWADAVAAEVVGLGWQGLLRDLDAGSIVRRRPPADHPLVRRANLIGVSVDDVGREVRLSSLVDRITAGTTLVVTRGPEGGTALTSRRPARSSLLAYPAIPADRVADPTGAGDVFLASLLATALDGERLGALDWPSRLRFAAAAASLSVERLGLDGVASLSALHRRAAEVA